MGGVRIGGAGVIGLRPDLVGLAVEDNSFDSEVWLFGNLATQQQSTPGYDTADTPYADPERSPITDPGGIPTEFVYCLIALGSGTFNQVRLRAWDNSSDVQLAIAPNAFGGAGTSTSMMPSWHPDGSKVVYVDTSFNVNAIRTVDRDGTNDTLLYTVTNNNWHVFYPYYSADGTRIAWVEREDFNPTPITVAYKWHIYAMDADGSNFTTVYDATYPTQIGPNPGIAWANLSNKLAFTEVLSNTSPTANMLWRTVNDDGTGLTTIHTINRAGYSFTDIDPGPIKWSWLSDDSAVVTVLTDIGAPPPQGSVTLIDAGGGGITDLGLESYYGQGSARPAQFDGRIYWNCGQRLDVGLVDSVLEDGTDRRTDFDGNTTPDFRYWYGFKGDTNTV